MPWYQGPTLLGHLEDAPISDMAMQDRPFRMAVQWVNRPGLDFRGYSGTQMWNSASIDAVVDGGVAFEDGDLPPTKIRFATADTDDGAKVRMEIMAGGRVEIGALDGASYWNPTDMGEPKLYVNQVANDYSVIFAARPESGPSYALRVHTVGETAEDWLLAGSSGPGVGSFKFSVYGNGDVNLTGVLKVDGVQVVGNQGAAIADATDAASAVTQLNLLLSRLRAHGLIAT